MSILKEQLQQERKLLEKYREYATSRRHGPMSNHTDPHKLHFDHRQKAAAQRRVEVRPIGTNGTASIVAATRQRRAARTDGGTALILFGITAPVVYSVARLPFYQREIASKKEL